MFLKRLELQGFKSFASKTALEFPEGITAVVGPNGSGKSNVTDAVRWLLGEREAKNLRGGKVDDLIFAGTEKRPRMGLAQAAIFFDNTTGFFPAEFKEVVISRRISRDGESKLFLNNAETRLKDIIDFFAKAKLGARGLNIIGQGESDAFLKASPLERREMVEEILGLKEYLLKKNSSLRELKNTGFNLEKARVLTEEIRPHLRILRRQVSRYRERENLESELRILENNYFGSKARTLSKELSKFEPEIDLFDGKIKNFRRELLELENKLKGVEASEPQAKKELEEIRKKRRELFDRRLEERRKVEPLAKGNSRDPLLALREIKSLAVRAAALVAAEDLRAALKKIVSLIESLDRAGTQEEKTVDNQSEKDSELNKLLDELDEKEKVRTLELQGFNKIFREALRLVEAKKDEIQNLEENKAKLLFEKERVKIRKEELESQLSALGRKFEEFVLSEPRGEPVDETAAERRIFRLRADLSAIGEIDEAIVKEAEETEARYAFLTSQIKDLESASSDLKQLIKELDHKIHREFSVSLENINRELLSFVKLMFGGGRAALKLEEAVKPKEPVLAAGEAHKTEVEAKIEVEDEEIRPGLEIEVGLPKKRIKGLEVLSGGERSLLSIAVLFALISISPPPFLVLDEIDAALDEQNARRFGELLKSFSQKTQFVIVTHNRATMEAADVLYGVTMADDGASKIISLKLS